jgi:hypothetical protein
MLFRIDPVNSFNAIKVVYTGPEIEVPVEAGCGDDPLCIDPTLAEVVLDNDNATHYSETGGGWEDKSNGSANNGSYRYGTDLTSEAHWTFKVAETNPGSIDLYNNSYDFGDVEVASVILTAGESYTVSVSGTYHASYTYCITADAIKLVHVAD